MTDRIASAVFDSREEAERALSELRSAGFSDNAISIVGRGDEDSSGSTGVDDNADDNAKGDVLKGATIGAGAGVLLGIAALAIPGVGPLARPARSRVRQSRPPLPSAAGPALRRAASPDFSPTMASMRTIRNITRTAFTRAGSSSRFKRTRLMLPSNRRAKSCRATAATAPTSRGWRPRSKTGRGGAPSRAPLPFLDDFGETWLRIPSHYLLRKGAGQVWR